jgi:hypothetical protein
LDNIHILSINCDSLLVSCLYLLRFLLLLLLLTDTWLLLH